MNDIPVRGDNFRGNGEATLKRFVKAPCVEAIGSSPVRQIDAASPAADNTVAYSDGEVRPADKHGNGGDINKVPASASGLCTSPVPANADDEAYLRMGAADNLRVEDTQRKTVNKQDLYDTTGKGIAHNQDKPAYGPAERSVSLPKPTAKKLK